MPSLDVQPIDLPVLDLLPLDLLPLDSLLPDLLPSCVVIWDFDHTLRGIVWNKTGQRGIKKTSVE